MIRSAPLWAVLVLLPVWASCAPRAAHRRETAMTSAPPMPGPAPLTTATPQRPPAPVRCKDLLISTLADPTAPRSTPVTAIPSELEPETHALVAELLDACVFSTTGVGIVSKPPPDLAMAQRLFDRPDAPAALAWLVVNGPPAARLYGYWGLLQRLPAEAHRQDAWMAADTGVVTVGSGCSVTSGTVGAVARSLAAR